MYSVVIYAPVDNAEAIRAALAAAGGGADGPYDSCSFTALGEGRFRPLDGARPAIGEVGRVCVVPEARIEAVVPAAALQRVLQAVRAAHMYEQPAIHVAQVLDYRDFLPAGPAPAPAAATATADGDGAQKQAQAQAQLKAQTAQAVAAAAPPPVCVALEGLDGVGKTTVAALLAAKLGAQLLRTPPDAMRACRPFFDRADDATRKAYYVVGNFVAGEEVKALLAAGRSVVLDRFHASTFAYRYGKQPGPLPEPGDAAYAWPPELCRPTHMVLLTLPHVDRVARRAGRMDVAETPEEALLRESADTSERINEAYRRFGCTEVRLAAGDSAEAVVEKVVAALGLAAHVA